jgi:glycogen phosphorylase
MRSPGSDDITRAAEELSQRLPTPLQPLAKLAYNYRWSWHPGGGALFETISPHRWALCGRNPVRLLQEADPDELRRAAADDALIARAREAESALREDLKRSPPGGFSDDRPIAFLCSEFGVHSSLPLYAGGLGVLAGDLVKEASDRALPMVGVSLLYRYGYFQQRADTSGLQHEYWIEIDAERLPTALVTRDGGEPLLVHVELWGRRIGLHIWRADVGRVPIFLLDAEVAENDPIDRWLTARLYDGNRTIRLGQYALLGIGGVRALAALGIEPDAFHLNEGHAVLAALELAARATEQGQPFEEAIAAVRERVVFTTHTPVPAGNETYAPSELLEALPDLPARLGVDPERVLDLGRLRPGDRDEPLGLTPLAIRLSRHANGVSRMHGEVARTMWHSLFPGQLASDVPIAAISNGVHLPTWMGASFRRLFERHLGKGWEQRAADPATWEVVDRISDEELWAARNEARARLIEFAHERTQSDRLRRSEPIAYVRAAARTLDPNTLTIGFARRLASYKRLNLLVFDPPRALALLQGEHPLQLLFAGKAHPHDEGAKRIVQQLFTLKAAPGVAERVAFLENYEMALACELVAGCDVWVQLSRPPLEASGTSGMKAALNGGLNLGSIDGWWAEGWNGLNGWSVDGGPAPNEEARDAHDAGELYRILESEIVPLFYDRDAAGIPREWLTRIRASLRSIGPRFCTARALGEYMDRVYRPR